MEVSFSDIMKRFPHPNEAYAYAHHYFVHKAPPSVITHRKYFKCESRGFGEDAFHAMWWLIFKEFQPRKCLEIGVYRGQVISLWGVIAKELGFNCEVSGISPFTSIGDSVSKYLKDINYYDDVISSFEYFKLNTPTLLKAFSTDDKAIAYIQQNEWDLIFIDGSHDLDIVMLDYELCKLNLKDGGLLIMDDSALYSDYEPLEYSFAGHPGPSHVAEKIAKKELTFLGAIGHNSVFQYKKQKLD